MAVEYLYNVIQATAGEDITICAEVTDEEGTCITEGCCLVITDEEGKKIAECEGSCNGTEWGFNIQAIQTAGLSGRYFYKVIKDNKALDFPTPIYFKG
jgi:hypothetical protein